MVLPKKHQPKAYLQQKPDRLFAVMCLRSSRSLKFAFGPFLTLEQALEFVGYPKHFIVRIHPTRKILYVWKKDHWNLIDSEPELSASKKLLQNCE
jgi:hypothetical protein